MFKRDKPKEVPEIEGLRDALYHYQDVKVVVIDKEDRTWTFYNDKLRGCELILAKPKIYEQGKDDIIVEFRLYAKNGRVGNVI